MKNWDEWHIWNASRIQAIPRPSWEKDEAPMKTHDNAVSTERFRTGPPRDEGGWVKRFEGMSNFDKEIPFELAGQLRDDARAWTPHAAWNFYGRVWFDGEQFCEEIWVYGSPRQIIRAKSLSSLMKAVNAEYGAA